MQYSMCFSFLFKDRGIILVKVYISTQKKSELPDLQSIDTPQRYNSRYACGITIDEKAYYLTEQSEDALGASFSSQFPWRRCST